MNVLYLIFILNIYSQCRSLPTELHEIKIQLSNSTLLNHAEEQSNSTINLSVHNSNEGEMKTLLPQNISLADKKLNGLVPTESNINGTDCEESKENVAQSNSFSTLEAIPISVSNTKLNLPSEEHSNDTTTTTELPMITVQISSVAIGTLSGGGLG